MSKLQTFRKLLKGDKRQILIAIYNNIVHAGITNLLCDKAYLKLTYWIRFGKKLHLAHPETFNEKLQWLKLHDRNPDYIKMVDKISVKDYVASIIGEEYIIPTLGVYDSFDEIDFESLPDQFVLKCNHDSGSVVICRDKEHFDKEKAKKKLSKGLKTDAFFWGREWPYKHVKRKILAEKYMVDEMGELMDYKIFTFSGKVYCIQVDYDRFTNHHRNFYTLQWEYMPFTTEHPTNPKRQIVKPKCLAKMIDIAEKLAKKAGAPPFLRVDLYVIDEAIFFGELTFYHGSGFEEFIPSEWDKTLGSWISSKGVSVD